MAKIENEKNILIEGLQGSGKSTLLRKLHQTLNGYHVYWEGDVSPIELAWCSYMTKDEYEEALEKYGNLSEEIMNRSKEEDGYRVVPYTQILTDNREFYQHMEQYEIYNSRVSLEEFRNIIFRRYKNYKDTKGIFECAIFQNIIEDLMLYYLLSEDEIIEFYKELIANIDLSNYCIFYIQSKDIKGDIERIRKERVDESGRELWYPLMMEYLKQSPYGQNHEFNSEDDIVAHFQQRVKIEQRILNELMSGHFITISSKEYELDELLQEYALMCN